MIQVIVEGHGEIDAMGKFLVRLSRHLGLTDLQFASPRRDRRLFTEKGMGELIQMAYKTRATGLLLIRDSEDDCPKEFAPRISATLQNFQPRFPVAYVFMYREFETLFLSVAEELAGKELVYATRHRIQLNPNFRFTQHPETKRDAKGALNDLFPGQQIYKPTLHQLPLVSLCQMEWFERADLPSFGSLKRALKHLHSPQSGNMVYPVSQNR